MFAGKGIELFDIVLTMDGLGQFDEERKHAIKIPLGRTKVLVLKVLSDALKAIQERERSKPAREE